MGKISEALEKRSRERTSPSIAAPRKIARRENVPQPKAKTPARPTVHIAKTARSVPPVPSDLITLTKPQSFEAEQFKFLRTNVLYPSEGMPPRSIMVTSAIPGEGKSFVSSNLSVSIAQNINEHVLLMDCDMRNPTIHKDFGYRNARGLSDFLSKDLPLEPLLLKTQIDKLTILPGGRPPHNPAELLSSSKMSELLSDLTARYQDRYIIIDSPPPHLTAETHVIARQVVAIVLVVKYGGTTRQLVMELIEKLGRDKIIGIVINWFNMRSSSYSGYGSHSNKYYRS